MDWGIVFGSLPNVRCLTGRRAALVFAGLVVLACATPTDTCACTRAVPAALVTGSVADSSGQALPDVQVTGLVSDSTCATPAVVAAQAASDSLGTYRMHVGVSSQPLAICLDVVGLRVHAEGFDSVAVRGLAVRTDLPHPPEVRVDLVFPVREALP